jgi:hypothetical protein
MDIFGYNLAVKFGPAKLERLRIANYSPGQTVPGTALLIWHGRPWDLPDELTRNPGLWVLVIGTVPTPEKELSTLGLLGSRVWTLPWGIHSFEAREDRTPWDAQPGWKRILIERFVEQTNSLRDGPPPWNLLAPPRAPEHVLACFLCLIAGTQPDPSWSKGFEEEISYWGAESRAGALLNWDEDSRDREKLYKFLFAVGALASSSEAKVTDARE